MGLADTAQLLEFLEHQRHGLLYPQVGILDDLAQRVRDITRRQNSAELATFGLFFAALLQAELQGLELDHAQRSLDAQHQLVVQTIQVIEVLRIGDQGIEDLTQLDQLTPVLVGA